MVEHLSKRSNWLDSLRGLAILGVVTVHSNQYSLQFLQSKSVHLNHALSQFLDFGKYGVEVFFVLSGWLLRSIYSSNQELKVSYYYRRIARIVPLWLAFFGIQCLLMFAGFNSGIARAKADLGTGITSNTLLIFFMTLTFTLWLVPQLWNTVIPGGWSIQAEVFHYIFYPLLRKSNPRNILRLLIGVNLFTLLSARAMELDLFAKNSSLGIIIAAWIRLNFYSTVGYFVIGYSISHLTASIINWQDISRTFMHKGLIEIFIYGFTFIFLTLSFGIQVQALIYVSIMLFLNYVFVNFSVFQPILITLGKYSYFIYFCHFLVLDVFRWSLLRFNFEIPWYLGQFVLFLIFQTFAIVISLTLAFVSFKLFESPIINWVKRF